MSKKSWQLGELNRYRVVSGDIDKVLVARNEMEACIIALDNTPDCTVDPYCFEVYCNWGYSNGKEIRKLINTDKVLKRGGIK